MAISRKKTIHFYLQLSLRLSNLSLSGAVVAGARRRRHRAGTLNHPQNSTLFNQKNFLSLSKPESELKIPKILPKRPDRSGGGGQSFLFFASVSSLLLLILFFLFLFLFLDCFGSGWFVCVG
jgi:hypothetical protein